MVQGRFGFAAGEHAGDFMDALVVAHFADGGCNASRLVPRALRFLGHHELGVRPRSHLCQMGDHNDLCVASQSREPFAQFDRGFASHASIDLIKDEGLVAAATDVRRHKFQSQHQSAELAARSAFAHRQLRRTLKRGEQESDIVATVRLERPSVPR